MAELREVRQHRPTRGSRARIPKARHSPSLEGEPAQPGLIAGVSVWSDCFTRDDTRLSGALHGGRRGARSRMRRADRPLSKGGACPPRICR
jgi:hypothetical protein